MTYDYTIHFPKDTPKEIRRQKDVGDIFENQIRCKKCNDIIRSKNRHDFVECSCKSCSIDGGSWYAKVSCTTPDGYEDMTTLYDDCL